MSQDIAVRADTPAPTVLTNDQLQYIAKTEFVPTGLRGNLPAILACVATGRALGLDDMTAIRSIHIIEGKATFSAELMVQLVRRAGHSITGEVTDGAATVIGKRADNGDTMTSTWTTAMAERAGLMNKGNWKKYPEAMLWARAVSQLCRMLFADCFAGATYTTEELGADVTDNTGVPPTEAEDDDRLFPPMSQEELAAEADAAAWAAGSSAAPPAEPPPAPTADLVTSASADEIRRLTDLLLAYYPSAEDNQKARDYIAADRDLNVLNPAGHVAWLRERIAAKEQAAA